MMVMMVAMMVRTDCSAYFFRGQKIHSFRRDFYNLHKIIFATLNVAKTCQRKLAGLYGA
jgi:hypothetical protein